MSFNFSHILHELEAAALNFVANQVLAPNAEKLAAALGAELPAGVDGLVALVESKDAALGPAASALINASLTSYKPQIEAELQALLAQGQAAVPALIAAIQAAAAKLAAK